MRPHAEPRHRSRRPSLLVPWLAYLAVTIAAPAANGAWRRPDFASHALVTFVVSGGLLIGWLVARKLPALGRSVRSGASRR